MLRIIFGPKRSEITREWRKLHSGAPNILYPAPNIVWVRNLKRILWSGA